MSNFQLILCNRGPDFKVAWPVDVMKALDLAGLKVIHVMVKVQNFDFFLTKCTFSLSDYILRQLIEKWALLALKSFPWNGLRLFSSCSPAASNLVFFTLKIKPKYSEYFNNLIFHHLREIRNMYTISKNNWRIFFPRYNILYSYIL